MKRTKIATISDQLIGKTLTVCGWIRTLRAQKTFVFIELNDGSCFANLQLVADSVSPELVTGAAISATGELVPSPGGKQAFELRVSSIQLLGSCPVEDYPLQKKRHSFEFLRTIAHLRPRTNTQGAVLRVRSALAFATHLFFQERGFFYIQTPIITASDCEGGGEQFTVSSLNFHKLPLLKDGRVDFSQDFFHRQAYLTVSGQLNAESLALALSDVYTFGPTFRAENSNTSRHLAEFWMIEPEMAFADLQDNIDCAEAYLKFVIRHLLEKAPQDLAFFDQFIEKGILSRLESMIITPFAKVSYTEAIEILKGCGKSFEFPVEWGIDLQSEHERFLAEEHFKKPVFVFDYPAEIKAFYMRANEDGKTVAAMDLLVPKIGELIGGSQREERLPLLEEKLKAFELKPEDYEWYLQLRKYGSCPHSGFGVGFERLIQFVTGMENIRDVIPFPRYPGHADF